MGTVYNYYSSGCNTNWAQIAWNGGRNYTIYVKISNSSQQSCFPDCFGHTYAGGQSPAWTDMIDGTQVATAYGCLYPSGGGASYCSAKITA